MYEVRVSGLKFRGFHGVFESERELGNDFVATIEVAVEGSADETDRLEDTVDYAVLADVLVGASDSRSFLTVEGLAGAFVALVFERFPLVTDVSVTIDKLNPPMNADVESCGVRLTRSR